MTYIPIMLGLSVDTSHASSVPRRSPTKIHSNVGWKPNAPAPMSFMVLSTEAQEQKMMKHINHIKEPSLLLSSLDSSTRNSSIFQENTHKETLSSYFVRCNELHMCECYRLESNHLHKPHTEIWKKKKMTPIAQKNKDIKKKVKAYYTIIHLPYKLYWPQRTLARKFNQTAIYQDRVARVACKIDNRFLQVCLYFCWRSSSFNSSNNFMHNWARFKS